MPKKECAYQFDHPSYGGNWTGSTLTSWEVWGASHPFLRKSKLPLQLSLINCLWERIVSCFVEEKSHVKEKTSLPVPQGATWVDQSHSKSQIEILSWNKHHTAQRITPQSTCSSCLPYCKNVNGNSYIYDADIKNEAWQRYSTTTSYWWYAYVMSWIIQNQIYLSFW